MAWKFKTKNLAAWTMGIMFFLLIYSLGWTAEPMPPSTQKTKPEPHLANIRQLTFSGKNAEAYFSPDGYKLVYQSTLEPDGKTLRSCYQIYTMNLDGSNVRIASVRGSAAPHVATFSQEADGSYFLQPILSARTARQNFPGRNATDGRSITMTFSP